MAQRKRTAPKKTKRTAQTNSKPVRSTGSKKKIESRKSSTTAARALPKQVPVKSTAQEVYVITADGIRGDTAIGDLLVFFPRTREVLVKKGLRLEAEDAGDIYMTLDAFSAMNGLKIDNLVQEIVEVAKQPLPQVSPPPLIAPSLA